MVYDIYTQEKMVHLIRMKASALELLEIILEETDELSTELTQAVSKDIDVKDIVPPMEQLWDFQDIRYYTKDTQHLLDEVRKAIHRAFHILHKLTPEEFYRIDPISNSHNCLKISENFMYVFKPKVTTFM